VTRHITSKARQIEELVCAGWPARKIADRLPCHLQYVYQVVKRRGLNLKRVPLGRPKLWQTHYPHRTDMRADLVIAANDAKYRALLSESRE